MSIANRQADFYKFSYTNANIQQFNFTQLRLTVMYQVFSRKFFTLESARKDLIFSLMHFEA